MHDDLLEQARALLESDRTRPKQASLRRAVSTAYYAVFHLLIHEATSRMGLRGSRREAHRRAMGRTFDHGAMKRACRAVHGGTLAVLGDLDPPRELRDVAAAFVKLQQRRHDADYDLTEPFSKQQATSEVERAEVAFTDWRRVRDHERTNVFLQLLNTYQQLERR